MIKVKNISNQKLNIIVKQDLVRNVILDPNETVICEEITKSLRVYEKKRLISLEETTERYVIKKPQPILRRKPAKVREYTEDEAYKKNTTEKLINKKQESPVVRKIGFWNQEDTEYLIKNYAHQKIEDLSEYLKRDIKTIQKKAESLGIKK